MSDVPRCRYINMDIPGLPSHRVILDSFFCGGALVATREPGVDFAATQDEHFESKHGLTGPTFLEHVQRIDFAYEIGTRDGKSVLSTQLHKARGWNDHFGDPDGPLLTFTGRSFKCGCGFKTDIARPGELYPPINHECNYEKYEGWRVSRDELDDARADLPPDDLTGTHVDPDYPEIVTKAIIRLPSTLEYYIKETDTHYELRLPSAECTLIIENSGVITDRRVSKGLNIRAPRQLRVPSPGELDLFRPWPNGGVGWDPNGLVQAVLPNEWADVSFDADEIDDMAVPQ